MKTTTQDKIIAGILVVHSLLGILWLYLISTQFPVSTVFIVTNVALIISGLIAGVGSFFHLRWAATLGFLFFAVQIVQISGPSLEFAFNLGLSLNISLGWIDQGLLGINLIALAMFLWSGFRVSRPATQSS